MQRKRNVVKLRFHGGQMLHPENLLTEHEVRFTQEGIPTKALRARLS